MTEQTTPKELQRARTSEAHALLEGGTPIGYIATTLCVPVKYAAWLAVR